MPAAARETMERAGSTCETHARGTNGEGSDRDGMMNEDCGPLSTDSLAHAPCEHWPRIVSRKTQEGEWDSYQDRSSGPQGVDAGSVAALPRREARCKLD